MQLVLLYVKNNARRRHWTAGGNKWLVVNSCGGQRDPDLLKDTVSAVCLTVQLEHFFNMHHRVPGF